MNQVDRMLGVMIKCDDIEWNTNDEGNFLDQTDIEARRHRDQMGLDTPVVYAVKYVY